MLLLGTVLILMARIDAHRVLERLLGDLGDGLCASRVELDGPDRV